MKKSTIPEGVCGDWKVSRFTVSEEDASFHNLRESLHRTTRFIQPGKYTSLEKNGSIIMSDTPAELNDHLGFVMRAEGSVMIHGLGLGVVTETVLMKPEVTDVTVIEIAPEVIELVAKHIADPRLTIIQADSYTYKPKKGQMWDHMWFDIWSSICADNLESMAKLKRKYKRYVREIGEVHDIGFWSRRECLLDKRRWG